MAIAKQTAQYSSDIQHYQARFLERLQALAHCHDLLVKDNLHGASFHDLVSAQISPFDEATSDRIDAEGPPIERTGSAVTGQSTSQRRFQR
jgi:two-component sensor histidine kinase